VTLSPWSSTGIEGFVREVRRTIDAKTRQVTDLQMALMTTGDDGRPQFNVLNGKTCTGPLKGVPVLVSRSGGGLAIVSDGRSRGMWSNGSGISPSSARIGGETVRAGPIPPVVAPAAAVRMFVDNFGDRFGADGALLGGSGTPTRAEYEFPYTDRKWSVIDFPISRDIQPEPKTLHGSHGTTTLQADITRELTGGFSPHTIDLTEGWYKSGDSSTAAADAFTGNCGFMGSQWTSARQIGPAPTQVLDETTPDWDATTDGLLRLVGDRTLTCSTVSSGTKSIQFYNEDSVAYTVTFGAGFAALTPLVIPPNERGQRYRCNTDVFGGVRQPQGGGGAMSPAVVRNFMDATTPVVGSGELLRIASDVTITVTGSPSGSFYVINEDSSDHILTFGSGFVVRPALVVPGLSGAAMWQIFYGNPAVSCLLNDIGYLDQVAASTDGLLLCAEFPVAYLDTPDAGRYWQGYVEDVLTVRAANGALVFAKSGAGTVLRAIYAANGFTALGSGTNAITSAWRESLVHITPDADGTWWVCLDASPVIGHVAYQGGELVLLDTVTLNYAASPHGEGASDGSGDDPDTAGRYVRVIYA
jgi:hypothetical protein